MSTETDLQNAIGLSVKILNESKKFVISNAANYVTMEAAALVALGTSNDAMPAPANTLQSMRQAAFSFGGFARSVISGYLPAYMRVIGAPDTGGTMLLKLYEWFVANGLTVKTRTPTFGAVSAGGGNIGTGLLIRLVKDRNGFNLESGSGELKTALCVADEHNGGTRHQESFEVRGAPVTKAMYPMPGQGAINGIRALSILDAAQYVRNPGFDSYDATNGATNWTLGAGAWGTVATGGGGGNTATAYKDLLPSTSTPYSLEFLTSGSIYQTFSSNFFSWSRYVPLYAQIAWQRRASATGTLKLKIGSVEVTVDVSTGMNNVWNILRWPINSTSPDKTAWFDQWNTTNGTILITMTSLAVGTVLIDELTCGPYTPMDGTWYALVGGATPFLSGNAVTAPGTVVIGDTFTWTDSYIGSINQEWFARAFPGFSLPGASSPTWLDPV